VSIEDIIARLRQSGYKITPQRVAIIKTVVESSELLTPAAIYEKVHQAHPEVGEVTVYRTLNILSELRLVCIVHTGENIQSYISRPSGHHDHLICSKCGKVVNFTGCTLSNLEKRLISETGFKIDEHRLDFFGECSECSDRVTLDLRK
jgi:Fur family ferric uptake transcriptional regulator